MEPKRRCPECQEPMETGWAEDYSGDPDGYPLQLCLGPHGCGYTEPAPADIQAHLEQRPRMPGL